MGNEPTDKSIMSGIGWVTALWLSSLLEEAEREAVLGDLVEFHETDASALAGVLSLVIRRYVSPMTDWRFWGALVFIILPASLRLSLVVRNAAGEGAVYAWMYFNNWDWALTRNEGFWYVLRDSAMQLAMSGLLLCCWSWCAGVLLSGLPNVLFRSCRLAFVLLLALFQLADVPLRFTHLFMHLYGMPPLPPLPDGNAPVTAIAFYRLFFPWTVLVSLVMLPAISGMRQRHQMLIMRPKLSIVFMAAAAISFTTILFHVPVFGLLLGPSAREFLWHNGYALQMLLILACWPTLYLFVIGIRRHWQHRASLAEFRKT